MGLLKTAATVAVASSVHGRVQRRQQSRWAAQDQVSAAAMPPPTAPLYAQQAPVAPTPSTPSTPSMDMDTRLAQLAQLGDLQKAGILTEAEFQQQKARILGA